MQHTIDEVEQLLKKHESFEKSAAAQEERFHALERLTTVIISLSFGGILPCEGIPRFCFFAGCPFQGLDNSRMGEERETEKMEKKGELEFFPRDFLHK